jgi:hypothetical protein
LAHSFKNLNIFRNKETQINFIRKTNHEIIPTFNNKKESTRMIPALFYNGFNKQKKNKSYYTLSTNINLDKNANTSREFDRINLSLNKNKNNTTRELKSINFFNFPFKRIKNTQNRINLKKENLYLIKEKDSDILNIRMNLKKRNRFHILNRQKRELSDLQSKNALIENKKKNKSFNYIYSTEDNKSSFENQYNKICKNKKAEKYLIAKEINNIGKKLSWIKEIKDKDNTKENQINEKKEDNKKENNEINDCIFSKSLKIKNPFFEINQASVFPIIMKDRILSRDLWKKDMIKYSRFLLNKQNKRDKKFLSDLLEMYD